MKHLEGLNFQRLTVLEFGQHLKSVCDNIGELESNLIQDEVLLNYIDQLQHKSAEYDKGILHVTKSDETAKITEADKLRDTAVSAALRYLSVFELSDDKAEHDAYMSLKTLFNIYKGIQNWNFEEETNGLDKLIADLSSDKYSAHVYTLDMSRYVWRMNAANDNFKPIFRNRTQEVITKEVYDVKAMRKEMMELYNDMSNYVLSMLKAHKTEQYEKTLMVLNTVRKYYAELLAKRKPAEKEKKDKQE